MTESIDIDPIRERFIAANQAHVLQFWNDLSHAEQAAFAAQLENIDLDLIKRLVAGEDEKPDFAALAARAAAPPAVKSDGRVPLGPAAKLVRKANKRWQVVGLVRSSLPGDKARGSASTNPKACFLWGH